MNGPSKGARLRDIVLPAPIAREGSWQLGCAIAIDITVCLGSWLSVGVLANALVGLFRIGVLTPYQHWVAFGLPYGALFTLLGYSEGLYPSGLPLQAHSSYRWILAKCSVEAMVIMGIASVLSRQAMPSPTWLLIGACMNALSLSLVHRWQGNEGKRKAKINVLIVGAGPIGRAIARHLRQNPQLGRVVRGFLDDTTAPAFGVLGNLSALAPVARAEFADEVVIASSFEPHEMQRIAQEARAQHLDVRLVANLPFRGAEQPWLDNWAGFPVVTVHHEHLPLGALTVKRTTDLLLGSALLALLSPLLLLVAIIIRLDSGGPSVYAAERVGRKGQRFRCYKFRTMVRNADREREQLRRLNERQGPCFKLCNDPRITRVGRILRRYSLDELPQLWNVMRGDMSLVGPRPHPIDDCARYDLPHLRRLDATPGMTGLWQVSARQETSFDRNLQLDLEYIERWSLGLDFKILAKTFAVVVRGTGT